MYDLLPFVYSILKYLNIAHFYILYWCLKSLPQCVPVFMLGHTVHRQCVTTNLFSNIQTGLTACASTQIPQCTFTVCLYLSGYVSMVPAMAPDVSGAQFQLLLQLLPQFLGRRLQQILLFGELHGTNRRWKTKMWVGASLHKGLITCLHARLCIYNHHSSSSIPLGLGSHFKERFEYISIVMTT